MRIARESEGGCVGLGMAPGEEQDDASDQIRHEQLAKARTRPADLLNTIGP
jgi:hypothetical protein